MFILHFVLPIALNVDLVCRYSERIYFHIELNYPWYMILNYILAFFCTHRN
jgi:hypothetical protein